MEPKTKISRVDAGEALTQAQTVQAYLACEFITLTRSGAPVCWPVLSEMERGRIVVSTSYAIPTKARNAQRNPKVAALFSDPHAYRGAGSNPHLLVQANAEVFDQDLQANLERFYDRMLHYPETPAFYRFLMRFPFLMKSYVGYMTRIYIETIPVREIVLTEKTQLPAGLVATRPASFTPTTGFRIPAQVEGWLPRYDQPPVLSFVDAQGYPAALRVRAGVEAQRVTISGGVEAEAGAPACLTWHRMAADMMSNDAFLIRGHFDSQGNVIPEKLVGWQGTEDDRGVGSKKATQLMTVWTKELKAQLAREGKPMPIVRPSPKRG
ncbi:MAG: hypothetical protein DWI57_10975 [Chloroflexi bacterium]|nr:MAG: hypothetical protein DWI57_10975 [Chloroflexota bacterium]